MKVSLKAKTFVEGLPESLLLPGQPHGRPNVMETLWLYLCRVQGKEEQNYHRSQVRNGKFQVAFAFL